MNTKLLLYCNSISSCSYNDAHTGEKYSVFKVSFSSPLSSCSPIDPTSKLKVIIERGEPLPYEVGKEYTFTLENRE